MEREVLEENIEVEKKDYNGFSEKKADLNVDLQVGQWHSVQLFKNVKNSKNKHLSREELLAVYHAVSDRLSHLLTLYCHFVKSDTKRATNLVSDLRKFKLAQDIILNSLVREKQEEFKKDMIPNEVWELCGI